MNPIFHKIENELLRNSESKIFRHIGASNMPSSFYDKKEYRRFWSLAPYSDNYYSILNPMYSKISLEMSNSDEEYPIVLLRDGAFDLFEFIQKNPDPGKFTQTMIVHHSLAKLLNPLWLENVIFYETLFFNNENYRLKKNKSKLLISTIINDAFFTHDQMSQAFKVAKEFCDRNRLQVELHLPIRENLYFTSDYKNLNPAFDLAILAFDIFGPDVTLVSDKDVQKSSDFREYYFYFAPNDKFCISDNYLEHYMLCNGADPMISYPVFDGYRVNLSSRHGASLFDHHLLSKDSNPFILTQEFSRMNTTQEGPDLMKKEFFNHMRQQFLNTNL